MPPAEARNEANHEEQGPQSFDGKGGYENRTDKTGQALVIAKAKAVPNGLSVLVAELLTTFHKEETDKGSKSPSPQSGSRAYKSIAPSHYRSKPPTG